VKDPIGSTPQARAGRTRMSRGAPVTAADHTAGTDDHGPSWVNQEIGGQRVMVLIGCTCGWRVDSAVADPDDALVMHAAAARIDPSGTKADLR
jgi:hypothetical protein